ncbi:MAG: biotin synthase BioB [Puniceicoccales bacterium]|jgi:biotin synthase|nr:biotin synthase BioB [Puniceicoccales bacterium]
MENTFERAKEIFNYPFFKLIRTAHDVHVQNFDGQTVQISGILSVKTGGCSEDCAYCAQSIRNGSKFPKQPMLSLETVVAAAREAKNRGASRFCMSTSGRCPSSEMEFDKICKMVKEVKSLGMETCVTIGMISKEQALKLKQSGLDYYNHNVDTSPDFYGKIISTHTIDDRIKTITAVQSAGINVCSGGIVGMGETNDDRIKMLVLLANLKPPPQCVPINKLVKIPGTSVDNSHPIDDFDFVRLIALARILMPRSYVKIAAGRNTFPDGIQALCMFAGANALFSSEKLLTVNNVKDGMDKSLFAKLDIRLEQPLNTMDSMLAR